MEKLVCDVFDKQRYVVLIDTLKQTMEHGLVLKKFIERFRLSKKLGWSPTFVTKHGDERAG